MKSTRVSVSESLKTAIKETKFISKLLELGCLCLVCNESNPFVIEWHHIGGKNNSSVTVPLCANCHVLATKNQLSYDETWTKSEKSDAVKRLYILKDLQFIENKIIQDMVNDSN